MRIIKNGNDEIHPNPGLTHLEPDANAKVIVELLQRDGGQIVDNVVSMDLRVFVLDTGCPPFKVGVTSLKDDGWPALRHSF